MSITPSERAQVLYLHHVEARSTVLIALMTGLSLSAVKRVVEKAGPKDVPWAEKAASRRPSPLGPRERPMRTLVYDNMLVCTTAAPQEPPPRRRHRRERRHDRT